MVIRTRTIIAPKMIMIMPIVRCRVDNFAGDQMWCSLNLIARRTVGKLFVALSLSKNQKHDDLLNICVIIAKIGHYCQTPPEIHWAALMLKPFGGDQMWCSLDLIAWLPVGKLLVALLLSKNKKHDVCRTYV